MIDPGERRSIGQLNLFPRFGESFLEDHAGQIMGDPRFAVVELVANCWDAGASRVDLTWNEQPGDEVAVLDDGIGMTAAEFEYRWCVLNYERVKEQGPWVVFPEGRKANHRKAFGRNGKGRHAMFCFSNDYMVETWCEGTCVTYRVERSHGERPFRITPLWAGPKDGHGTRVSTTSSRLTLATQDVRDLIGSTFVADPQFEIYLNGARVELTDLTHLFTRETIEVLPYGAVHLLCFDGQTTGRTTKQHGVAWWVNNRLVGVPSWGALEGTYLDGRTAEAKRYTFVVQADVLEDDVKADWSGFHASERRNCVVLAVDERVIRALGRLMTDQHRSNKRAAIERYRNQLSGLPLISQVHVGRFLDEVQVKCPTLTPRDLANTTQVLIGLERSRSGYELMEKLASLPPGDLDAWNEVVSQWTAADAQVVLGELQRRLRLIKQLEKLFDESSADELHALQPLFERGLWIFGPEFESVHFTSNRRLTTSLQTLTGRVPRDTDNRRADFVVAPNGSIGVYSAESFDENGEVDGLAKVVIVEIKRGGFRVTRAEVDQTMGYAVKLRKLGDMKRDATVTAFVLGASLDPDACDERSEGNNRVMPRTYGTILRQAHARTFHLLEKMRSSSQGTLTDPDMAVVLSSPAPADLFDTAVGSEAVPRT